MTTSNQSFETFKFVGMALDPIHVGTGGTRLGRVDNTIVRDPVTRIPKIPGSSLAGVMRAYVAMKWENDKPGRQVDGKPKPYYPDCAGLGQPERDGTGGHCGQADCPVCTVFGFAKGTGASGGFAGLAAFSDMQVLLFPVASQLGPQWITCPMALRLVGVEIDDSTIQDVVCSKRKEAHKEAGEKKEKHFLNLGWLLLPVETDIKLEDTIAGLNRFKIPRYIKDNLGVVSDKLFTHIVNSNLEVRTSVAINPATGAAEEGALFTYEALPRGTVLFWELTCRNPKHFKINQDTVKKVDSPEKVRDVVTNAHSYLEHLGIGGMGSRGMGRLRVLATNEPDSAVKKEEEVS
jgi:CRISPR-associated protein Cmr4